MRVPEKQEFSTFEVAELAGSCERIINRFFDAKRLRGYRDEHFERRVPRDEVLRFFQCYGVVPEKSANEYCHDSFLVQVLTCFVSDDGDTEQASVDF